MRNKPIILHMNHFNKIILISLIILINCLSRNAARLSDQPLKQFETDFVKLEINLNNFNPSDTDFEIYIQDIDSFYKNPNVFSPTFYFDGKPKSNSITLSLPKGKYVGFISLSSKDLIPYYRSILSFHLVYFGIDKEYKKIKKLNTICIQETTFSNRIENITNCNILDLNRDSLILNFTLESKNEINYSTSFSLLWFSFSYAFLSGPQQYPYALFLIGNGYLGILVKHSLINFDNHAEI
ncbi:hypothetical protein [Leptospira jelokensis]|uniref:hypothetical protein n=1 Tax=Leptospira jelokensis TaxID=2484931 RepID=UPI001FD18AA0|nr:hypothetical protein [Leptospira jelokensis]